ncbi:unnamed protein product [Brachionus calyciflorus]|uniref:ferroxidase n=1 Tax=Brachionus calyciflorus TaxID=104777 RepID=A0A813V5C7_9BILA|nr:unnamed protein product [Brachionus calyciflorus]
MYRLLILLIGILSINQALSMSIEQTNLRQQFKSRATQNFGVNCLLNRYLQHEFDLGFEYLNASIYMRQDRVALHGFGKMFHKFWLDQIDSVDKISSYIVKRGGSLETPGFKLRSTINQVDHFTNESSIIKKFLDSEKRVNSILHHLHASTSDNRTEIGCASDFNRVKLGFYELPSDVDPYSANFLDENFLGQKVEKIKFMADLFRQIIRFDQHPRNVPGVAHHLNPLGIIQIDGELLEKFK